MTTNQDPIETVVRRVADAPPCATPCPKCGASDIHRRHYSKGDQLYRGIGDEPRKQSKFVKVMFTESYAKRECIAHSCRCCGYDWETDIVRLRAVAEAIGQGGGG